MVSDGAGGVTRSSGFKCWVNYRWARRAPDHRICGGNWQGVFVSVGRALWVHGGLGARLVLIAGVFLCRAAQADVIVLRDGQELNGHVVSRDASSIVVRVAIAGGALQRTLTPAEVREIRPDPAPSGIAWLEIPVFGEIGTEVTADAVGRALAEARRLKVRHVILLIDSPGGRVDEQMAICDRLLEAQDLRPVAFVKHAYSAAALIATACPTIVMQPDGQIGGAVAIYPPDKAHQLPRTVEEKYMSVIRARDRLIAERAGHDPLFVDAMSNIESVVSMRSEGGHVHLLAGEAADARLLKGKGSILTMTAREASSAGLSAATVSSLTALGTSLGYAPDEWHSAGRQGWLIMTAAADGWRAREAEARRNAAGAAASQQLTAEEITKRLAAARDGLQAVDAAVAGAKTQLERDQQAIQYTSAAYSRELYQQKQAEVQARYDKTVAELARQRQTLQRAIAQLREMQKD